MKTPVLLTLLLCPMLLLAQTDTLTVAPADTLAAAESLQVMFLPGMGSIGHARPIAPLDWSRLLWSDTKSLEESLWLLPGSFLRDLGEAGKPSQVTALGFDARHLSLLMDGRPLNDPVSGAILLSDLSLEFADRIEAVEGTSSLHAASPAVSTWNIATRWYNTLRPITRIRFVQDPKETLFTDAFFTQNIMQGVNLQLGINRQVSQGRYLNAELDAWNIRTRVRWNASDRINIAATYLSSRNSSGMNGGIDLTATADPFDAQSARPVDEKAYALSTRQDLSVQVLGRLLPDTLSTTHMTAYMTASEREYVQLDLSNRPTRRAFVNGESYGVRIEQRLASPIGAAAFAAEQEWRGTERTELMPFVGEFRSALSATARLTVVDGLIPSATIRTERMYRSSRSSVDLGLQVHLSPWVVVEGNGGSGYRFPTLLESSMTDSLLIRRTPIGPEQHEYLSMRTTFRVGNLGDVSLRAFQRTVSDAIVIRPDVTDHGTPAVGLQSIRRLVSEGVTGSLSGVWSGFEFEGTGSYIRVTENDEEKRPVPGILLGGELSYRGTFFGDALEARIGARVRFSDRFRGASYDPLLNLYVENQSYQLGRVTTLDLFTVFQIGDAYVTLAMQNVLDAGYLTVPIYPMPPRQFRIGVNWTFKD